MQKGWTNLPKSWHLNSEEKLHLTYIKPSLPELFYPDSDNSQQHVLREDEKQSNYIYLLLLLFEKLSILKLRDFLMWMWFKCDSYIFSYFQFLCMSLYSSPVRPRKPPPAVKAHGTTFHTQPDYLAGIKTPPFVYFEQIFVLFEDLHYHTKRDA